MIRKEGSAPKNGIFYSSIASLAVPTSSVNCIIDTVGPGTTLKPPLPRSDRIMHQNSLTFLASAAAVSLASRLASVVRRFLSSVSGTAICYDRG